MNRVFVLLGLLLGSLPGVAQEVGTFTMVEGSPRVIRGIWVLRGVEGMRFQTGDIIETSSPGFVQAEFSGGSIVAIGPGTKVWIHTTGGKELALMSGWLKGENSSATSAYSYTSSQLSASSRNGSLILHSAAGGAELYVESGSATVGETAAHGQPAKAGQFFSRHSLQPVAVASRPDGPFIQGMPIPFRDTLPSRLSHFASKKPVEPKHDHEVSFGEIEPWLKMSGGRKAFEDRFQARLRDGEFRRAVEPHLAEYPEWDRVLHPEKYQQNSPTAPAETAKTPSGRN